jgi:hypothetical protein
VVGAGTAATVRCGAQAHGTAVPWPLEPDAQALAVLKGRRCWRSPGSAIRTNSSLTLRDAGIDVGRRCFADHHRYRRFEARELIERAEREGLFSSPPKRIGAALRPGRRRGAAPPSPARCR